MVAGLSQRVNDRYGAHAKNKAAEATAAANGTLEWSQDNDRTWKAAKKTTKKIYSVNAFPGIDDTIV